jgi:hypothetical protein
MSGSPAPRDAGPGILETGIILGASLLLAAIIVVFLGGPLGQVVGLLVDVAHGGH